MNISHLKLVSCTAELKSFSRAAEKCNVTQSTLSNGVSEIEETLGAKLFIRTTRSVQISPFGQMMIPLINSILASETNLLIQAKNYLNPEKILIKIGASPLLNPSFTSLITQAFVAANSTYEIILIEDNFTQLNERLASNELDFIFVPTLSAMKSWKSSVLYEEPLVLVTKDASLLSKKAISAKDSKSQKFVMVPDSCGLSVVTRELFQKAKIQLNEYEGKALSYSALADWANNGLGSALLPKSKIPKEMRPIPFVDGSGVAVRIQYRAIWNSSISANLKVFIPHLKDAADRLSKGLFQL